jgi:hypothetical protein
MAFYQNPSNFYFDNPCPANLHLASEALFKFTDGAILIDIIKFLLP